MNVLIKREYDYAIRICAYLASLYPDKYIPTAELVKKIAVPRPTLYKVIHQLKKNNIVDTLQGKHGGVFLLIPPEKLSLWEILQAMGYNSTFNECVHKMDICPLTTFCKIHLFFLKQEQMFVESLKKSTIKEFMFADEELQFSAPVFKNKKGKEE